MQKTSTRMLPPQKAEPPLSTAEWDFSSCPQDQMRWCDIYEHSRENSEVVKAVEKFRQNEGNWDSSDRKIFADHSIQQMAAKFFELFPEFPATPFLKIDGDERARRCAELDNERAKRVVVTLKQIQK